MRYVYLQFLHADLEQVLKLGAAGRTFTLESDILFQECKKTDIGFLAMV